MENRRQIVHILIGLTTIAFLFLFGRGVAIASIFITILIGLIIINQLYLGRRIPVIEWIINNFERKNVHFPGWGSACYATGVLLLCCFLTDINTIAACILIIALGDGLATIIGKMGRISIPYNKNKKIEGSVALFISSLAGYIYVGPLIFPAALVATIVESLPMDIDDNISLPIALIIFFMVV